MACDIPFVHSRKPSGIRERPMLIIRTGNAVAAWREALVRLADSTQVTDNDKYFRDEPTIIELETPSIEPADPMFPISQDDLTVINRFICSGEGEDSVCHEWTKLYYHRIFDEPNSQVEYMIRKLQCHEPVGEAQISFWDKLIDQDKEISPCAQIIWARKRRGQLETHVHAHSSDAYKKLLMNLQEFIAFHLYLAKRLNIEAGRYIHFIDSCHIHTEDRQAALELANKIMQRV